MDKIKGQSISALRILELSVDKLKVQLIKFIKSFNILYKMDHQYFSMLEIWLAFF